MTTIHESSNLSKAALGNSHLRIFGRHLIDGYGRIVQLRGVNVSGASKLPSRPDGLQPLSAHQFFQHEHVSFVGRPFPLEEAPHHFARLQAWGLTVIRLLVTWEALSHAGPNPETDLDDGYIAYLHDLLSIMPRYGIKAVICAHQDVWSRFSGGSGAPAWTFEKAGLDIEAFKPTGAAYVDVLNPTTDDIDLSDKSRQEKESHEKGKRVSGKSKPEPVGAFVWPSGYQKLAAATMATLFWAGVTFAWKARLPHYDTNASTTSINIQEYLQSSYIEAFGKLIDKIGPLEAVIGVDIMNEPHRGYVGISDWHRWNFDTDLHIGFFPSLLQSLALGSGYSQAVPFYVKSWPSPTKKSHMSIIDPLGKSVWLQNAGVGQCMWRAHGAWEWDKQKKSPVIMKEDFFLCDPRPGNDNRKVEWYRDCYAPFLARFTERMRRNTPHLFCFVEPIPNEFFPPWSHADITSKLTAEERLELMKASYDQDYAIKTYIDVPRPLGLVYAPHFYDLNVLFYKAYNEMSVNVQALTRGHFILNVLYFGKEGLQKNYKRQISNIKEKGQMSLGSVPTFIGEVGIPWDLNNRIGLKSGDYHKHIELLDTLIEAMEQQQIGFTLWNYNPNNTIKMGDGWNREDFSITCKEESRLDIDNRLNQDELYKGGRGLDAIIRPYAVKVAGFPFKTKWDKNQLEYEFHYINGPGNVLSIHENDPMQLQTEIYLPKYHFDGYELRIQVKDGSFQVNRELQSLYLNHVELTPGYEHIVRINVIGNVPKGRRTKSWYRLSIQDTCTLITLAAVLVFVLVLSDYVFKPFFIKLEQHELQRIAALHSQQSQQSL